MNWKMLAKFDKNEIAIEDYIHDLKKYWQNIILSIKPEKKSLSFDEKKRYFKLF